MYTLYYMRYVYAVLYIYICCTDLQYSIYNKFEIDITLQFDCSYCTTPFVAVGR